MYTKRLGFVPVCCQHKTLYTGLPMVPYLHKGLPCNTKCSTQPPSLYYYRYFKGIFSAGVAKQFFINQHRNSNDTKFPTFLVLAAHRHKAQSFSVHFVQYLNSACLPYCRACKQHRNTPTYIAITRDPTAAQDRKIGTKLLELKKKGKIPKDLYDMLRPSWNPGPKNLWPPQDTQAISPTVSHCSQHSVTIIPTI